jgi:hypothetical protein
MTRQERIQRLQDLEALDIHKVPLRTLELAWIDATALYEVLDAGVMSDGLWDRLTKLLWTRRSKLSPYFRHAVPHGCLSASTGSGIDWSRGIPFLAVEALREP